MGVLLMLMTIGGLIVAAISLAIAWTNKIAWLKQFVLGGVAIWFAFYVLMLLGTSLLSEGHTIAVGDPEGKAFCGFYLDCHMHVAVNEVTRVKMIGNKSANGEFYILRLKIFSDAKAATLGLTAVEAHVVDEAGNTYARDIDAESLLPDQPPFEKPISPVESFEKEIIFVLPVDVQNPRLDVVEGIGIDRAIESVLIGDEDSVFHERNYFALADRPLTAGVSSFGN